MLAWLTFLFTKTIKIRSRKSGSVSNSAEIVAVLRTAYRVFFENSQMLGAACRNERKFVPAVWRHAGTGGNLFPQVWNTLEQAEICPRSLGTRRNRRKLSQCYALLTDFSSKTRKGFLEKHKNLQTLFASQTTAACLWQEITHKKEVGKRYIRVFFTGCRFSRVAVKSAISCLPHDR